ncbi:uncharacterized protein LOC110848162 [Folsomia candida]|uniref:Uncharacterized protein n=1 Tax=Folsomia candida TaxID=158441 RepID=A0A226EG78_FOLCA|nr:uncharacterized protein LOC110848162 [Folsomia candida]OXA56330.1 hypothetical protein Fcan01_08624 [Folsomia candida]
MNTSSGSASGSSIGGSGGIGALTSFIKLGFLGIGIFGIVHLIGCYFLSWIIGHDFSTVVYVTAAAVVTGTLVVFTISFLVTLNIVLTAVTGLSQGAMNMFGGMGTMPGGGGGGSRESSMGSVNGNQRSHISEVIGDIDLDHTDGGMKLD